MTKNIELDNIDKQIIEILTKDAKAKLHVIAKALQLPASTVHFRIQRLEKDQLIKHTLQLNYNKLGLIIKAIVIVNVSQRDIRLKGLTQSNIAKEISKIYGVESVDIITGEGDLIVVARTRNIEELNNLLLQKIQGVYGIENTKTMIVLEELSNK